MTTENKFHLTRLAEFEMPKILRTMQRYIREGNDVLVIEYGRLYKNYEAQKEIREKISELEGRIK